MKVLEQLLTAKQFSKRIGVSEHTLAEWRMNGENFSFIRIGDGPKPRIRYPESEAVKYIERHTTAPAARYQEGHRA